MSRPQLVLDASAAFHLVNIDETVPALERYDLVAPELMYSETLSALSQAAHRGEMPTAALWVAIERLNALSVTAIPTDDRHRRATLDIAQRLGWAKTYDAEYVALAREVGCPVLTIDGRLRRGAAGLVDMIGPDDLA